MERGYVFFDEWPLQILLDTNALISDAISSAVEVDYGGVPTRVFTAEHLCAIAIQTGRGKDLLRVTYSLSRPVDRRALEAVLIPHDLRQRAADLLPLYFQRGRIND